MAESQTVGACVKKPQRKENPMEITTSNLDSLQVIADNTEKFLPEATRVKNLIRTLIILRVTRDFNRLHA